MIGRGEEPIVTVSAADGSEEARRLDAPDGQGS